MLSFARVCVRVCTGVVRPLVPGLNPPQSLLPPSLFPSFLYYPAFLSLLAPKKGSAPFSRFASQSKDPREKKPYSILTLFFYTAFGLLFAASFSVLIHPEITDLALKAPLIVIRGLRRLVVYQSSQPFKTIGSWHESITFDGGGDTPRTHFLFPLPLSETSLPNMIPVLSLP